MADRISIQSFSLQYSPTTPRVLSSMSLEIPGGTCCAILGPTGAGKSSFLQCLAGTMHRHHPESVSTGTIQIGDRSYKGVPREVLFPAVGLALQDPHVQISGVRETVFDEILFTIENTGQIPKDPGALIVPLLHELGIDQLANRKPTSLSGGETQRVALATILVAQPSVLLLDEPTTAMDLAAQGKLKGILQGIKQNTTIVLTDTQLDFALGICDHIVILEQGKILFDGTPAGFLRRLDEFRNSVSLESWLPMKQNILNLIDQPSTIGSRLSAALGIR